MVRRFSVIELMGMSSADPSVSHPFVYASDYDALAAELAEQVDANTELVRRDVQSCNGLNVANRRVREIEADRDQISLTLAVAKADRDKWFNRARDLEKALTMLYDKWENGDGCYEDPETCGGFLGNAFKLSQEEENQVLALIGTTVETGAKPAERTNVCKHYATVENCPLCSPNDRGGVK